MTLRVSVEDGNRVVRQFAISAADDVFEISEVVTVASKPIVRRWRFPTFNDAWDGIRSRIRDSF